MQNAQPPYSNSQVSETAVHREILNIYQRARPETKFFYDKGRDTQGLEEENWVIRWLLWHVFRYRDNRNKNRRQGSPDRRSPSSSENSSSEGPPPGGDGMFPVFKTHLQAAEVVSRQQWTIEWSFELEWEIVHRILRPGSKHSSCGLKLHFRELFVRPFAGYTAYWCLAERRKSRNLQHAGGHRLLPQFTNGEAIFAYLLDFMVGVACGTLPVAVHLLRVPRTFPLRNNLFSVSNANIFSKAISHRSCIRGSYLSLKLGDRGRLKVCNSVRRRRLSNVPSGGSGTVVLFHAGTFLQIAEEAHACIVSNGYAYYTHGGSSGIRWRSSVARLAADVAVLSHDDSSCVVKLYRVH